MHSVACLRGGGAQQLAPVGGYNCCMLGLHSQHAVNELLAVNECCEVKCTKAVHVVSRRSIDYRCALYNFMFYGG
eukprot:1179221-Prorocentrum_minimum.AAC.4